MSGLEKKDHLDLYHQMVLIRRIEERAAELYQQGKIGGFLHLYIGQEAVSTGLVSARLPQDRVITAYRDHFVFSEALRLGIKLFIEKPFTVAKLVTSLALSFQNKLSGVN